MDTTGLRRNWGHSKYTLYANIFTVWSEEAGGLFPLVFPSLQDQDPHSLLYLLGLNCYLSVRDWFIHMLNGFHMKRCEETWLFGCEQRSGRHGTSRQIKNTCTRMAYFDILDTPDIVISGVWERESERERDLKGDSTWKLRPAVFEAPLLIVDRTLLLLLLLRQQPDLWTVQLILNKHKCLQNVKTPHFTQPVE